MNIALIGPGNVGGAVAAAATPAGHHGVVWSWQTALVGPQAAGR